MTEVPISEKTYFREGLHYVFPCTIRRSVIATAGHCPAKKQGDTYENKKWRIVYRGRERVLGLGSISDFDAVHKASGAKFFVRGYYAHGGWAIYIAKEEHDKIAETEEE